MKNAGAVLTVIGGSALLFALALATPASADAKRQDWRNKADDRRPRLSQDHRHHRPKLNFGSPRYRYFGDEPGRYFGVGPGSYECYGYDCNW